MFSPQNVCVSRMVSVYFFQTQNKKGAEAPFHFTDNKIQITDPKIRTVLDIQNIVDVVGYLSFRSNNFNFVINVLAHKASGNRSLE